MGKKTKVNQETCIGCAACTSICPSVFDMNSNGLAENILGDSTELPDDFVAEVEEAAASCPVNAIEVE